MRQLKHLGGAIFPHIADPLKVDQPNFLYVNTEGINIYANVIGLKRKGTDYDFISSMVIIAYDITN